MVSRHPPDSGKRPKKLSAAHLSATTEEWIEAYSEIVKNEGYEPCGKTGRCQLAGRKFESAVFETGSVPHKRTSRPNRGGVRMAFSNCLGRIASAAKHGRARSRIVFTFSSLEKSNDH